MIDKKRHNCLNFAPHIGLDAPDNGMFTAHAGLDPIDQIKFIADQGFAGIEDNFLKLRSPEVQNKIGETLDQHNLKMGCFVNNMVLDQPTFVKPESEAREVLLQQVQETIEVAKRVNGKYVTTLSGPLDPQLNRDYQTVNMIENLKYCAELAESAGIVLGIEAITGKWWTGTFLTKISHAYLVVKAVNSPAVKLIFDTFHVQIEQGNILDTMEQVWDEIACFQIADVPFRAEPTSGEINYPAILKHIHSKGYNGLIEMEYQLSKPELEGEQAVLEITRRSINFEQHSFNTLTSLYE